jgi:ArsR family transcriptional regulator
MPADSLYSKEAVATRRTPEKTAAISPRELRAITRVLADPRRFQILRHIASQACTACSDLRSAFPITPATLSHHLKELESCGLVETARRGKFVDVTFQRPAWEAYLEELKKF